MGILDKFFEKWKKNRLSKFAKQVLKDNPELEKDLEDLDAVKRRVLKKIRHQRGLS